MFALCTRGRPAWRSAKPSWLPFSKNSEKGLLSSERIRRNPRLSKQYLNMKLDPIFGQLAMGGHQIEYVAHLLDVARFHW